MGIRLTLALTLLNFLGQTSARVVFTLYALELGASASAVGVIGGLLFLFPLLLSWPVGRMADRRGARGWLLFATVCGGVSLAIPWFVRELAALYVAAALNGLALAFYHVILQNMVGVLSKPEDRPRYFSYFSLAGSTTHFLGPLIAGLSIDYAGHAVACLVIAVPSLVAVVLLLVWGHVYPPGRPGAPRPAGGKGTLADREIWRMLGISALVQLGADLFTFYLPVYGHSIGLSASVIGAVLATLAVAAFIVRLFLARLVKQVAAGRLLSGALCMGAVGFALVPFFSHPLALAAIAFVFGLGMGLGVPLTVILMFSRSAEGRSGQALGLRLTSNNFVRLAGPIVFGAIGSAFGLPPVFWINAALMAAGSLLMMRREK
ncbi:MAG TPA: MFS transporter [Burkholderiales bacterium]|nr:MFS transporter [Burkholderiales bacterium]